MLPRVKAWLFYFVLIPIAAYGAIVLILALKQRSLLYFPSHHPVPTKLSRWQIGGAVMGYAHEVPSPRAVWLMLHGNAGQASERDYVLNRLAPQQSLYVMEFPGYGGRPGSPSRESFDRAASEAYDALRAAHPGVPVCVLGESIGSGPAAMLARKSPPPDKIVLVTPFATLAAVAAEHMPMIGAGWLLRDRWDNVEALRGYQGKLEIYGAADDRVIPYHHAANLAAAFPDATFRTLNGGHNTWSDQTAVSLTW